MAKKKKKSKKEKEVKLKKGKKKKSKKEKGKKSKKENLKPSKNELAVLKALGKEFEIVGNKTDEVPYTVSFRHKGLQFITGGLAGGIFIEAHGPSQCGKSYLMMEGGMAYINAGGWYLQGDIERAYKRSIGKKIGLEGHPRFVKTKERNMEALFKKMMKFVINIRKVDKHCPIFLGVDSFNPLQINATMKELEKELKELEGTKKVNPKDVKGYAAMRKNARFSDLMRDFIDFIEKHKVTFLLLNQQRTKHGVVFGDRKTTNADDIIQFYASLRLRGHLGPKIRRTKETNSRVIGRQVTWEVVKSRHPDIPPFMRCMTEIIYKTGLREYSGLADLFVTEEIASKCKVGNKNAIEFDNGDKVVIKNVPKYVEEHPELLDYTA